VTEEEFAYDQRQYKLMLDSIRNFQDGDGVSLSALQVLINRLDALYAVLNRKPDDWSHSFQPYVNTLDELLGVLLDRGKTALDEEGKRIVIEAMQKIIRLVQSQIAVSDKDG
jgi:hypothetical protein